MNLIAPCGGVELLNVFTCGDVLNLVFTCHFVQRCSGAPPPFALYPSSRSRRCSFPRKAGQAGLFKNGATLGAGQSTFVA